MTYIDIMKRQLESKGHEVSIFSQMVNSTDNAKNIYKVNDLNRRSILKRIQNRIFSSSGAGRDVYSYGRNIADHVARVHARNPIDVFEIEESFGWSRDLQALESFPVVVRLHGPTFLVQQHRAGVDTEVDHRIEQEGTALRTARYITAPAQCTLDETTSHYGLQPKLSLVIPNPYSPTSSVKLEKKPQETSPEILFVGRFDSIKGADKLLDAFSLIVKRHRNVRLIFAGPDMGLEQPDGKVLHFEDYSKRHLDADVRDRIRFLGKQTPDQIRALRARASVTVVTSRWENQPYALLEAMAEKCAVAAFAAGGIAELVTDGRTGLSAPPECVEALATQIERLLLDPGLRDHVTDEASRYVNTVHDPSRVAEELSRIYRSARDDYSRSALT